MVYRVIKTLNCNWQSLQQDKCALSHN